MTVMSQSNTLSSDERQAIEGARAADLIWQDHTDARRILDPRTRTFANAVITGLSRALATMPGAIGQVVKGAASAAEDLNVEPFQGLVEIIQNADDLGATEVRFALREKEDRTQLLVVHNGRHVVCHDVLAMALPYLTTKRDDPNQKGRFGIGLNTLARISTRMLVHSKPYHFSLEHLAIDITAPENALDHFYAPASDTLIVLDLNSGFRKEALRQWFDDWDEDGLLFLSSVCRFRWCDLVGRTIAEKSADVSSWTPLVPLHSGFDSLSVT
jgi:hypothetical protein